MDFSVLEGCVLTKYEIYAQTDSRESQDAREWRAHGICGNNSRGLFVTPDSAMIDIYNVCQCNSKVPAEALRFLPYPDFGARW